jgi:hypothetical protein
MSLVIEFDPSKQGSFEPPTGVQQAVVTHVTDLGNKPDPFKEGHLKHQVAITWQLNLTYQNKEGKTLPVRITEMYNMSMNEKAKLRLVIEGMMGKSIVQGEKKVSLDLDKLVGRQCMLTLQKKDPDSSYSHVVAAAPIMKDLKQLEVIPMDVPQWVIDFRDGKNQAVPAKELEQQTLTDANVTDFLASV